MKYTLYIFLSIILFAAGCKKDSILPSERNDKNYFPVQIGDSRIYNVDSIHYYDVTMTSDTFQYQLKEEITQLLFTESLTNGDKKWYEVTRYKRATVNDTWNLVGYAMASVSEQTAEWRINNLHFIKLSFPVVKDKTWKGNAFLSEQTGVYSPDWDYAYTTVDTVVNIGSNVFDSCVVVNQLNNQNFIERHVEKEVYSRNKGLLHKLSMHVERQTLDPNNWIPEKGFIRNQYLAE